MRYTFLSNGGSHVEVTAESEVDAREAAMVKLYGPTPEARIGLRDKWLGLGLYLKLTEE